MTSTLPPDPWKALGVERHADKGEIRTAYKKLVLKCHPDKVQDPTLKALKADEFQKVQQAWELLNDDAEIAKYEQKLRLAELQRAAKVQQDAKHAPNTSVPRTSKYSTYNVHTVEPTSKYKSSPSAAKVYTMYTATHARSHEEMPSSRSYAVYDEVDKQARRAASYEKPLKRDEERREREREERRRRREEEEYIQREREKERERARDKERERDREREKELKEREARKAEKKRLHEMKEKIRVKERKQDADDKSARNRYPSPYFEENDEPYRSDEVHVMSRSEKKRSSSRKHDEPREREREREQDKSSSRRTKSPHLSSDRKHVDLYDQAASYLASAGSSLPSQKAAFWMSQAPLDSAATPLAPTPPPVDLDFEDDSIRRSSARAAGRRASNEAARSREKLRYDVLDATPKGRPIPTLAKSYSTPPLAPESPPRVNRSHTTPLESYSRPIPSLGRTQTWAAGSHSTGDYYEEILAESDEDRERRRSSRRSRRTRSPSGQPTHRYKVVDGIKTSKLESQYAYVESPSSRRYAPVEVLDAQSPSSTYQGMPYRVKETKNYGPGDVMYSDYGSAAYYSGHVNEGYTTAMA